MADQPQTVAVPIVQARALNLIQNDPEAFRAMQAEIDRLDPEGKVIPKNALPDIALDKRIARAVDPIRQENADLKKKLADKEVMDFHRAEREHMKREHRMTDAQVDELTKWMNEDSDGNVFKSYEAAYMYKRAMSQATLPQGSSLPSTQKTSAFSRQPLGSEPWREAFKRGPDAKNHPLRQSRADARAHAQEQWQKADQEWQQSRR